MIFAYLLAISIIITLTLRLYLPKIITSAENDVLIAASEIQNNKVSKPVPALLTFTILFTFPLYSQLYFNNITLTLVIYLTAISSVIDIARKWVPDILIYLITLVSCLSFYGNIKDAFLLIALSSTLVMLLNYIALLKKDVMLMASGDLYLVASMSLWLSPFTAFCFPLIFLFIGFGISHLIKSKNIPFVPVLLLSFIMCLSLDGVY